jgi:hypothetical protein
LAGGGRPASRRSSSDQGSGGFCHPMRQMIEHMFEQGKFGAEFPSAPQNPI